MQTRIYAITDPMGATRIEILNTIPKDGKARRREEREKQRKMKKKIK